MAWPDEILTTYSPDSPVKSNDLVLIQQTIVKLSSPLHVPGISGVPDGATISLPGVADGSVIFTSSGTLLVPVQIQRLRPVSEVIVDMLGDAAADVTINVSANGATWGSLAVPNVPTTRASYSVPLAATITVSECMFVAIFASAAAPRIFMLRVL